MKVVRAQSVSEYTICVAVVILAVIATQSYLRRGLQGRYADLVDHTTASVSAQHQYEPYYINSEEGTEDKGAILRRQINTDFQPKGKLTRNILQDTTTTPQRVNIEGIDCYEKDDE